MCRGHFQAALPALFISAASASARSVSHMKVPSADLLLSRASFSTHPKNIKKEREKRKKEEDEEEKKNFQRAFHEGAPL